MKGTIKKITSQKGGFLNFLRPLMTDCLPSMKSVFTPLAKSVLLLLELFQKHQQQLQLFKRNVLDQAWHINNFKQRNERYHEIVESLEKLGLQIKGVCEKMKKWNTK